MENTQLAKQLAKYRESVKVKIEELQRTLSGIDVVLAGLDAPKTSTSAVTAPSLRTFSPASIRGMKQLDALMTIAKFNGGIFPVQEAKNIMIQAGVMKDSKHSNSMIYTLMHNSEKFERVKAGVYKIKGQMVDVVAAMYESQVQ
jgi:hypothetical protein